MVQFGSSASEASLDAATGRLNTLIIEPFQPNESPSINLSYYRNQDSSPSDKTPAYYPLPITKSLIKIDIGEYVVAPIFVSGLSIVK